MKIRQDFVFDKYTREDRHFPPVGLTQVEIP